MISFLITFTLTAIACILILTLADYNIRKLKEREDKFHKEVVMPFVKELEKRYKKHD